jgi:hypothetical protein
MKGIRWSHHYSQLIDRWRAVGKACGIRVRKFAAADGCDLFYARTPALAKDGGVYLSAGIHGDEPGGPAALLEWAAAQGRRLRELPLIILPCLNPWGLRSNVRMDAQGNDLNRAFHREDLPQITALRQLLEGYRFDAAVMLHEDYDGEGLYLYEIQRSEPNWGESLLAAGAKVIPLDPRSRIDRYHAREGLIRRRFDRPKYRRMGHPEAIWLHLHHSERTFTVETPSEFALEQRVAAHGAVLDEVGRLCGW